MAPDRQLVVKEYWTDSQSAVVLAAGRTTLEEVARLLNLPSTRISSARANTAVLGIWGDHLYAYEELKRSGTITLCQ